MKGRRALRALAAGFLAAIVAWAGVERWIGATVLPPLAVETGRVLLDREGRLLHAETVADGRWRFAAGEVDPGYVALLLAYEDKRFRRHGGVDLRALARATSPAAKRQRPSATVSAWRSRPSRSRSTRPVS
ncbi:MAG: hypothetical protein AAFW69_09625, partial [Pseudomonadota bacterium]